MRWLDGIIDSMDMKHQKTLQEREAWGAADHGIKRI